MPGGLDLARVAEEREVNGSGCGEVVFGHLLLLAEISSPQAADTLKRSRCNQTPAPAPDTPLIIIMNTPDLIKMTSTIVI